MARNTYYGNFENLSFPKRGSDILARCVAMRGQVEAKIGEREARIRDAAAEAGMKDAADVLLGLDSLAEGTSNNGDMTVGLAAKVRGEVAALGKDKEELRKLVLIIGNLVPDATFNLDFGELQYFGF